MKAPAGSIGGHAGIDLPGPASPKPIFTPLSPEVVLASVSSVLRQAVERGWSAGQCEKLRLRERVGQIAAALSFRRALLQEAVPFSIFSFEPLAASPGLEVSLAGRPCLLMGKSASGKMERASAERLLWLVQSRRLADETVLVLYSLALKGTRTVCKRPTAAKGNFAVPLPAIWSWTPRRARLETLHVSLEGGAPAGLTLYGLDGRLVFRSETVHIQPGGQSSFQGGWTSVGMIGAASRPAGRLCVSGAQSGKRKILNPGDWQSLQPEENTCIFEGYVLLGDMRRWRNPATCRNGHATWKQLRMPREQMGMRSLRKLFGQAKNWTASSPDQRIYKPENL